MVVSATSFITTSQLDNWINLAIAELRDALIQEFGDDYYATVTTAQSVSVGTDRYPLPADFYKAFGVDVSFDNGVRWRTIDRFEFADRNLLSQSSAWSLQQLPRYRLLGSNVMFTPAPDNSAWKYRIWYAPTITRLAQSSDVFDFVHGWDDWVACRVAIRMLQKEESDSSALERDLGIIAQRIGAAVRFRDSGAPKRVQDTARRSTRSWSEDLDEEGF